MVVVVVAGDAIVAGAVGGRVTGPCLTVSRAAGSATRSSGLPSTEWLHRWGTSGMSSLLDSMSLESFILSLIGGSMQLALYGRV